MRVWIGVVALAASGAFACGGRSLSEDADSSAGTGAGGTTSSRGGSSPSAGGHISVGAGSGGRLDGAGGVPGTGANGSGGTTVSVGGASPVGCEGALTSDRLDPNRVYLAGTLSEGACYRDAIASWSCPNAAVAGFDCDFDSRRAQITTDQRLLYVNTFEERLREFHCDSCPVAGVLGYPPKPLDNDPMLTAACPTELESLRFLIAPDAGAMYRCGKPTWRELNGKRSYTPPDGDDLVHVGYAGLALTRHSIVQLDTGASLPIVGLPDGFQLAIRARPDGAFLIALEGKANTELWQVDAMGTASPLGDFPNFAKGIDARGNSQLEPSGVLLTIGSGPDVFEDVIVRRSIDGTNEIVYDEASDPLVKIHISDLITGP